MNTEPVLSDETRARQRKGRMMMLAIVAIFVLPFFVLPLFMSPEKMGKTNKGILLDPPVAFSALQASDVNQRLLDQPPQKKWALLYIAPTMCEGICLAARDHALFALRQIPVALGRDLDRVQSLVVVSADLDPAFAAQLKQDFSTLVVLHAQANALNNAFAQVLSRTNALGNIYLMSPDGYIFMYYPAEADEHISFQRAEDIRSDLKKSLQGSRI